MTSKADSLINLNRSSSVISLTTQKSKKTSLVHEFTRVRKDHEPKHNINGNPLLYYSLCSYSNAVTTNFRRHLKSKHEIDALTRENRTKRDVESRLMEY